MVELVTKRMATLDHRVRNQSNCQVQGKFTFRVSVLFRHRLPKRIA